MPATSKKLGAQIKKLPDTPGVYLFYGARRKLLYIGKATALRSRVRSYFNKDMVMARSQLIAKMVENIVSIEYKKTDSVLEALILESLLIKKHQPPYNTDEKDDKSFNYLLITKEKFPRVLIVRGKDLIDNPEIKSLKTKAVYGPFPHGGIFKEAMKIVRHIFPYRDTCVPADDVRAKGKTPKPCFNHQIGLCPGVCFGSISETDYRRIIRNIQLLFEGKKTALVKKLTREMKTYAKAQEFEKAQEVKRQVFGLTHIRDVTLIKEELRAPLSRERVFRIEAYDVAHISGTNTVGSMVVVEDGEVKKSDYRKFRMRSAGGGDDLAALRELLSRRLKHAEWPLPDLIVVDGGRTQKSLAEAVLKEHTHTISLVSVVKDERHKPLKILGLPKLVHGHRRGHGR